MIIKIFTKSMNVLIFAIISSVILKITDANDFDSNLQGSSVAIVRAYFKYVLKEVKKRYVTGIILDPITWCMKDIHNYERYHQLNDNEKLNKCGDTLTAEKALKYAYLKLKIAKGYYFYMRETYLKLIDLSNILNPQQYCDHHYRSGGSGDVASTSGAQKEENPVLDLALSL